MRAPFKIKDLVFSGRVQSSKVIIFIFFWKVFFLLRSKSGSLTLLGSAAAAVEVGVGVSQQLLAVHVQAV